MKASLVAFAVAASLVACGGSGDGGTSPAKGALAMGIISGNNQIIMAGKDTLPQPVVGKLVRRADGSVAWIRETPERFLDLIVPRAFAQGTVVNGSPIAGGFVCPASIGDSLHKMTPFVACTTTASDGTALIYFTTGTIAGVDSSEIRGSVNGEPAVFDTATAVVTADTSSAKITALSTTDTFGPFGSTRGGDQNSVSWGVYVRHAGDTLDLASIVETVKDKYGNTVTGYTLGWTLTQLTTQTLTNSSTGNAQPNISPFPSTLPFATPANHMGSTATTISGFAAGYMQLDIYVNGYYQFTYVIAVLP